jgi:hypothetical protein
MTVIDFNNHPKVLKKIADSQIENQEYFERLNRICDSLIKINKLLAELKAYAKVEENNGPK